jgi:outer membrane protein assembly factor BamB
MIRHGDCQRYRRIARITAVLTALIALAMPATASAVDPWPMDGQNSFNQRYSANGGPAADRATKDLVKVWQHNTDSAVLGTPIIADNGAVYFGTETGTVYALAQGNGRVVWARWTGGADAISTSLLKVGNTIYAAASPPASGSRGYPYLWALDATTGDVKWKAQLDGQQGADACSSPAYSASRNEILVGTGDCSAEDSNTTSRVKGGVTALDAATGAFRWQTRTASVGNGATVRGTPLISDGANEAWVATGHAYTVTEPNSDSILQLDLDTGAILRTFQAHKGDVSNNSQLDLQTRLGFTSPLVAADYRLGVGAEDGNFYIIDAFTMKLLSKTLLAPDTGPAGIASSASFDQLGKQFVGVTETPSLYFGLAADGSSKFLFPGTDVLHKGPVSITQWGIWSTDQAGFLDVQYRPDGHILGRVQLAAPSIGGISFANRMAYVAVGTPGATSGAVEAFK